MTLYIDESELRKNSLTKNALSDSDYVAVGELESLSGGDALVSIASLPPPSSEALLKLHLQSGAVLVQIKHGHDLSSSMGERLNTSLSRMHKAGAKPWQSILLFVGYLLLPIVSVLGLVYHFVGRFA